MLEKKQANIDTNQQNQFVLKAEIESLQKELELIEQETNAFEALLRSKLAEELIEVQELRILYKKSKQLKKEKRLEQKRRGKNYKEPVGIKLACNKQDSTQNPENQKEIKRLYREAMLHVHPDKFSMAEEKIDLATEVTSKLINTYQAGNLLELKLLHRHITSGNAMNQMQEATVISKTSTSDLYLKREKEKLEALLLAAKSKHTYKVLREYPDPNTFIDELKIFYTDKIVKLRKRTRRG